MEEIILIGGGGHCKSVIDVIEQEGKYKILGIVDKREKVGDEVLGYKIIGRDDELEELKSLCSNVVVTVGHVESNKSRVKLFSLVKELGYTTPTIISPLAYVSQHAQVKEGCVVMHHAIVNANATVGKNCIINSKALIEHDSVIEDNVHISTTAVINGGSLVRANTFFGSGAIIREYADASGFIKAGSVVK